MLSTPPSSIRVLFVLQQAAHYRRDVYSLLERSDELHTTFLIGKPSRKPTIPSISTEDFTRVRVIRNVWLGRLLWQSGLLWQIVRSNFDTVIFEGDTHYLSTWVGAAVARLRRRRVLFWTTGWHRPETGPKRWARLCFYLLAHKLLLYGFHAKHIGQSLGYPVDRMVVIGNSISTNPRASIADVTMLRKFTNQLPPIGTLAIGAVIRLTHSKRLDLVIRAAHRLRRDGLDIVVLLVGAGPEQTRLQELAVKLSVPLYLPGAAYSPNILAEVYSRMRVTVVPSLIGLTVLQSHHYGVPAISHDDLDAQASEVEAILPGITGSLYRRGDLDDLAARIREWITLDNIEYVDKGKLCQNLNTDQWSAKAHSARIIDGIVADYSR